MRGLSGFLRLKLLTRGAQLGVPNNNRAATVTTLSIDIRFSHAAIASKPGLWRLSPPGHREDFVSIESNGFHANHSTPL